MLKYSQNEIENPSETLARDENHQNKSHKSTSDDTLASDDGYQNRAHKSKRKWIRIKNFIDYKSRKENKELV